MKYLLIILLSFCGCAVFTRALDTASVAVPPIADVFSPGLGTTIGAIIGGISIIGGGISTLIVRRKKRKS